MNNRKNPGIMDSSFFDPHTRVGTAGGTLLVFFLNIQQADIIRTAVLTSIAAVVSFIVSLLLKLLLRWIRSIRNNTT
jgi:hypothetical protein